MAHAGDPPRTGAPTRRRSTRDRPAKAPLSEEAVVDAALAILGSEGLEAVTMRRVAAALDTGPASLYVYVAGREGLLRAMQDRITATVPLPAADPSRWRPQLHALLAHIHRALVDHPGMAATTLGDLLVSETVLAVTESLLGILLAGGLAVRDAAWACDILLGLVVTTAVEDDLRRARSIDLDKEIEGLGQTFAGLPAERFPLIAAHAAEMVAGSPDERLHYAVDVFLDGMLTRADRPARAPVRRSRRV